MNEQENYSKLVEIEKNIGLLGSLEAICSWDESTYLPSGGVELRGEQKSWLAKTIFEKFTEPERLEKLTAVESSSLMKDPKVAGNVREIRKSYDRATKIPVRLVQALAVATTQGFQAWQTARAKNDFSLFAKELSEILELKKEEAQALASGKDADSLYDEMMDPFEPGASTKAVRETLSQVKGELSKILKTLREKTRQLDPAKDPLLQYFPIEGQRALAGEILSTIGFNLERGRLDTATHPFCSGFSANDVRLTTRYAEKDFSDCFFSVLHEGGHGLYEQGLSPAELGLASGRACSMGVHESQSRFWENIVGRSEGFWEYYFPVVQRRFPDALSKVTWKDFHRAVNQVKDCFIRVDSDEVSYNLHVILRFELEQEMLTGKLVVKDLPERWNSGFKELFGITPANDQEGCLQDIHWSLGSFGYFPTYALGNLYSAQFAESAEKALGSLSELARQGKFSPIRDWLNKNIHASGATFLPDELCKKVTGSALSAEPFLNYLRKKYSAIYGISL